MDKRTSSPSSNDTQTRRKELIAELLESARGGAMASCSGSCAGEAAPGGICSLAAPARPAR